jgi:hypothetical protein
MMDADSITLTAEANQTERYSDRSGIDDTNVVGAGSHEAAPHRDDVWTASAGRLWAIVARRSPASAMRRSSTTLQAARHSAPASPFPTRQAPIA